MANRWMVLGGAVAVAVITAATVAMITVVDRGGDRAEPMWVPGTAASPAAPAAAPYLDAGLTDAPAATEVMASTGVRWFTLSFVLARGGCHPAWDGTRPIQGGPDARAIAAIRAAGGDVAVSFGGERGSKLGPACADADHLARAYEQVIDAYRVKVIDIDIENNDEFEDATVRDRILDALRIVKDDHPAITTVLTFGTDLTGPGPDGTELIRRAKQLGAGVDVYTIMPFDFGQGGGTDLYAAAVTASQGLQHVLSSTYGWSEATAYRHMGVSAMNGLTDSGETLTPAAFARIRDWARQRRLARLAVWSVNRDRPCPGTPSSDRCSSVSQSAWQYTRIAAGF